MASMVSIVRPKLRIAEKAIDLRTIACCLPIIIACLMSEQVYKERSSHCSCRLG